RLRSSHLSRSGVRFIASFLDRRRDVLAFRSRPSSGGGGALSSKHSEGALMSTIKWSGRTWQVRSTGLSDPGPNRFARSLVTVDASGHLHLKIAKTKHVW